MLNELTAKEKTDRLERLKKMLVPKGATEDLTIEEKVGLTIERFIAKLDEVSFTLKNMHSLQVSPLAESINDLVNKLQVQKEDKAENTKSNKDLGVTINRLIVNMEKFVRTSHAQTEHEQKVNERFNHFQVQLKEFAESIIAVSQSINSIELKTEIINIKAVENVARSLEEMILAQSTILQKQIEQTERLIKSTEKIVPHKKQFEDDPIEQTINRDSKGRIKSIREVFEGGVVLITTFDRDNDGNISSIKSRKE